MAVPERFTVCGLFAALSASVTAPSMVPLAFGEKVRFNVQVPSGAMGETQLSVSPKSPLAMILVMVSETVLLVLVKVTVLAVLVVPTT
jgi:hypothetical protein